MRWSASTGADASREAADYDICEGDEDLRRSLPTDQLGTAPDFEAS
jgi:hypothetical protein